MKIYMAPQQQKFLANQTNWLITYWKLDWRVCQELSLNVSQCQELSICIYDCQKFTQKLANNDISKSNGYLLGSQTDDDLLSLSSVEAF